MKTTDLGRILPFIVFGIAVMGLGCKGFTPGGVPWSKAKSITGKPAEIVGGLCMTFGAALVCFALYALSKRW